MLKLDWVFDFPQWPACELPGLLLGFRALSVGKCGTCGPVAPLPPATPAVSTFPKFLGARSLVGAAELAPCARSGSGHSFCVCRRAGVTQVGFLLWK